ncbi:Hypothetical predicted protein [Marmota monax]|uniref:UPAR/Ly6 domain-containing protein n=1 Tax=Marmota monax TaxID=9995 RepID=A0A5E4CKE3_MARMO|nr:Hypothetical predicted protein [Marmota monax]
MACGYHERASEALIRHLQEQTQGAEGRVTQDAECWSLHSSPKVTGAQVLTQYCHLVDGSWSDGFTPGGPPLGKVSISTMKVALTAAIFAALVAATAGEFLRLYQDMSCSGQNCTQELDPFTVHVASGKHVHFASQCCQGQPCENDSDVLGPEVQHLLLKGCSDISNSTCQLLGTANQTVRGIIFRQVQCSQASLVPNTSGSFKASLSSWVLGSLPLLGLLL